MAISKRMTNHLASPSEKKEWEARLRENKDLFGRVTELLMQDMEKSRQFQLSRESFDSPSWGEKVAYEFGYQKAMEEIINLLNLER